MTRVFVRNKGTATEWLIHFSATTCKGCPGQCPEIPPHPPHRLLPHQGFSSLSCRVGGSQERGHALLCPGQPLRPAERKWSQVIRDHVSPGMKQQLPSTPGVPRDPLLVFLADPRFLKTNTSQMSHFGV